jgi:LEA14-like dessication related protein
LHRHLRVRRSLVLAALLTALCLGLSILTLALSGCSALAYRHLEKPAYRLVDVAAKVNASLPPSIDLDLTIGVDNPNPVALRLDAFDFVLFANEQRIANGATVDRVAIPPNGSGDVRLRAHLSYSSLKTIYRQVVDIVQGGHAHYTLEGNATFDTPLGQRTYPVKVGKHKPTG